MSATAQKQQLIEAEKEGVGEKAEEERISRGQIEDADEARQSQQHPTGLQEITPRQVDKHGDDDMQQRHSP